MLQRQEIRVLDSPQTNDLDREDWFKEPSSGCREPLREHPV
jgi:hypothetical protein